MFKIQTLNKIAAVGLDVLPKGKYEIADNISNPDGIIVRSAKMHDMEFPASLKAIARAGAGVNNIPIERCSEAGIVVFNTPGANANSVKELVIAGLLLSSRKIVDGINWVQGLAGTEQNVEKAVEKGKSDYIGPEIKGKKLGVIGLGAIGVMVANAAVALEMQVTGYDPYLSVNAAWGLSSSVKRSENLDNLMASSDYLSLHVPLNDETREMINSEKLRLMKNGVRILNFSRGELVNDEAILEALKSGKVTAYVTDFPNKKLLKIDGVIPIPHLGASTPESEDNCAVMASEEIQDYLENGNIRNSVNFPDAVLDRGENVTRITLLHKNVPNMVGQITTILANEKLNIDDMLNKSKGDLAYTIIDIHKHKLTDDVVNKLSKIVGVLKVRII